MAHIFEMVDWVKMLTNDGVSREEAIDMAVDFFGIDDAKIKNQLIEEVEFFHGKPKKT
jgi:hypothetical protein